MWLYRYSSNVSARYRLFACKYIWQLYIEKEKCLAKTSKYILSKNPFSLSANTSVSHNGRNKQAKQFSYSALIDSKRRFAELIAILLKDLIDR